MTTATAHPSPSPAPAAGTGRGLGSLLLIEERSPVESLTVYRALVVCHIAGAVFAVVGWLTTRGATAPAFQTATLVVALVQLVVASWLLRNPAWLPRLLLGFPRASLALSVGMAVFYLGPATDPIGPPTTTVAFAWIANAAAVLPRRSWPAVGLAMVALLAACWASFGLLADDVGGSAILIGAAAILPGCVNGAWMGSAGNALARRLRRWGLLIGEEAGSLDQLQRRAAAVRVAADRVLGHVEGGSRPVDAIAVGTLRQSSAVVAGEPTGVRAALEPLVAELRVPFAITLTGEDAPVEAPAHAALTGAILRHLSNVYLHAPAATTVSIAVAEAPAEGGRRVVVTLDDDGGGQPPTALDEGDGTALSRAALDAEGGTVAYSAGPQGVRLALTLPRAGAEEAVAGEVGLVSELRGFVDRCLRNNRYAAYASPVPFLLFGMDAPWWALPLLLLGGAGVELAFRAAGPSADPSGPGWPLLLGASIAVATTLLFALGLRGDQAFVCSAATAYPIVELAWRGRWRAWLLFEVLRGVAVLPWLVEAGAGGIGGAMVLPIALTLIGVGARRLVVRAGEVEARIGTEIERRQAAQDLATHVSLRHDVVGQLGRAEPTGPLVDALDALDVATRRLADEPVPPARPVDDVVRGARAALAPVPVVFDLGAGRVGERGGAPAPADERAAAPLQLERRLAMLDLGATVGELLAASSGSGPTSPGRPRAVRADVTRGAGGEPTLRFRVDARAPRRGRAPEPIVATDPRVTPVEGGVDVVLTHG